MSHRSGLSFLVFCLLPFAFRLSQVNAGKSLGRVGLLSPDSFVWLSFEINNDEWCIDGGMRVP